MSSAKRPRTRSQPEALLPLLTPRLPQTLDRRTNTGEAMVKLFDRIKQGESERRNFRDRRATPRVNVGLALEAGSGEETMRLITNDLSTFGLSISGGKTPKKGTRLTLKLFLPDEPATPLVLEAEVLGPLGREDGVRMRFLKPDLEAVRRIHKLVK
ncbi:MAG: PilZ domain-containing protein [Archangium sp.]|nr:PilZ domain-containing protein [Archangium sp.]MDP3574361.1 PilZ domain-containing protein [Archangium sp.]